MKIPLKKYVMDEALSWEERYRQIERHHEEETSWMTAEIKRLEGEPATTSGSSTERAMSSSELPPPETMEDHVFLLIHLVDRAATMMGDATGSYGCEHIRDDHLTEWLDMANQYSPHGDFGRNNIGKVADRVMGAPDRRGPDARTVALHRAVQAIMAANLWWEEKYNLVFEAYQKADIPLEWYDPDTSYEEDVRHFAEALEKRADALLKARGTG